MTEKSYSIGTASTITAVNIETIRYYERIGLLPAPDRTPGGNRQYAKAHLKRIGFVKRARSLGFSIEQIRSLLTMTDQQALSCAQVSEMTADHLVQVREKIADLQKLEKTLADLNGQCRQNKSDVCPVIEDLFGTV
ncbi:MerR family transcriptional regulator [Maritalea myrionectae]|uniref:MerR family transcriptional regulator n=1 Tax=Maritalea myrionectae TaxID=454601 RepID=UPI00048963E3|nr:helix-turn-helix domain-containing protein [Maritalea myrionectae]